MKVLQFLKRCFTQQRSKNTSLVESLPNEIIQHIANLLPLHSAAAFALCSHRIYVVLGTSYWEGLKRHPRQRDLDDARLGVNLFQNLLPRGEREELLSLLERDLPNLILCYYCTILHPVKGRYDPRRLIFLSYCMSPGRGEEFSMIQMIMKRYRLGLSYWRQRYWFSTDTTYRVGEARIAQGKFLYRKQCWLVFPTGATRPSTVATMGACVCPHITNHSVFTPELPLQKMVTCRMSHWRDRDYECPTCSGLKQCPSCHTEFQIDAGELGNDWFTIAITTWWDLGSGVSPYELEYQRHSSIQMHNFDDSRLVKFEAGSIQGAFGDHGFSVDSTLKWNRWLFLFYAIRSDAMG